MSYNKIDFCWYLHENKSLGIYESGKGHGMGSYSPSDIFAITYDNHTIRYLHNGQVKHGVPVGAGKTFHLDSSLHMQGKTDWATSMITFGQWVRWDQQDNRCKGSKGCKWNLD